MRGWCLPIAIGWAHHSMFLEHCHPGMWVGHNLHYASARGSGFCHMGNVARSRHEHANPQTRMRLVQSLCSRLERCASGSRCLPVALRYLRCPVAADRVVLVSDTAVPGIGKVLDEDCGRGMPLWNRQIPVVKHVLG